MGFFVLENALCRLGPVVWFSLALAAPLVVLKINHDVVINPWTQSKADSPWLLMSVDYIATALMVQTWIGFGKCSQIC